MKWQAPQYRRGQVDAAGRVLAAGNPDDDAVNEALTVLNNWRLSHSFPLNTLQMGLRQKARNVYASALVAQRLKRVPSIVYKLQRFSTMNLSQMQDIGGCRAVVRNVQEVRRLRELYSLSRSKHLLVNEKDYIVGPKESGYRGIHLVYRFASAHSPEYSDLLIEIQLRSRLQHAWATAVETVGTFLRQALKASQGEAEWLQFFKLAGSAFATIEASPLIPGTPSVRNDLLRELRTSSSELDVGGKLRAYGAALNITKDPTQADARYFLLSLKPQDRSLVVHAYRQQDLQRATDDYLGVEKQLSLFPGAEAVLVAAESLDALRRSYPNYFLDTQVFLERLERFISRRPSNKRLQRTAPSRRR